MKKILIIHTVYSRGGAAKIARQIFEYLNDTNEFNIYFAHGRGDKSDNQKIFIFNFLIETYLHAFLVRFLGVEGFGSYFSTRKLINFIKKEKFDLIHIHNLHGYYLDFFRLMDFLGKSEIPVIWTHHDEWPVTWLPAYSMGCSHCKTLIGKCVNSYKYPKTFNKLFARILLNKKQECFSKKWKPIVVCPSEWIKKSNEESYLKRLDIKLIRNGVNTEIFRPLGNKDELRKKYNIPDNKKIVLFSVLNIKDVIKGYNYIFETAKKIANEEVFFIGVGNPEVVATTNLKSIGFITDEKSLAEVYNLADVFLYTSLQESFSLTVLESMSCGLPVVAFNVQGVQELINKDCGLLAEPGNMSELIANLRFILGNEGLRKSMGISARKKAVNNLSLDQTLFKYKKLYNEVLNK